MADSSHLASDLPGRTLHAFRLPLVALHYGFAPLVRSSNSNLRVVLLHLGEESLEVELGVVGVCYYCANRQHGPASNAPCFPRVPELHACPPRNDPSCLD